MLECPWCEHRIELVDGVCPVCMHEVLPEHLDRDLASRDGSAPARESPYVDDASIESAIRSKFRCSKCDGRQCIMKEVAMSGTGLSKIFDIEYNHYLFVTCTNCGFVEVYNPDVLRGRSSGEIGTVMDLLFG